MRYIVKATEPSIANSYASRTIGPLYSEHSAESVVFQLIGDGNGWSKITIEEQPEPESDWKEVP